MKGKLLIVDDDEVLCGLLERYFEEEYAVTAFSDPEEAIRHIRENPTDVVVTDLNMPRMDGLELLRIVKAESLNTDVIIMTAYAKIETAIEAMRRGAFDYIIKPFTPDELSLRLKNLFEKRRLFEENINLRKFVDTKYRPENIIGESKAMGEVRRFIERVSQTDATVLIRGESGTGKELAARSIHFSGKRKGQRLLPVHCAALPQGFFEGELSGYKADPSTPAGGKKKSLYEEAKGGTIVLSEIGDMDITSQAKLLGLLENRTVRRHSSAEEIPPEVMLIATTNRDLNALAAEGRFRNDLLYRLNMLSLRIPPLRERKEDIPLLAEHFIAQYEKEFDRPSLTLSRDALEALQNHDWPGNVRELRNLLAEVCLLEDSRVIRAIHLLGRFPEPPQEASAFLEAGQSLGEVEKNLIREALKKAGGNMVTASKILNIGYDTLRYRMKKFGIKHRPYKQNNK